MEFVVIDGAGKEIDWIDPVEEDDIRETKCYWIVNNGYCTYRFWKYDSHTYVHREIEVTE